MGRKKYSEPDSEVKAEFSDIMNPKEKVGSFYQDEEINRSDASIFYRHNSGEDLSNTRVTSVTRLFGHSSRRLNAN